MATDQQIAANRRNAQKCQGPQSAAGKAASSQNAIKTGIYSKSEVIATENRDEYESLISEYYDRFRPATPEQRCLVDDLIRSEWLGRRYMAATSAMWEYDFREMNQQDMGLSFIRRSEVFSRAQRLITANQRNFAHALKQLLALQSETPASQLAHAPESADKTPVSSNLVSFRQSPVAPAESPAPIVALPTRAGEQQLEPEETPSNAG